MRILIINSEYPPLGGGAGNASAHIAHALTRMGYEIVVITTRFRDLPHKEQNNGLTVYRIPAVRQMPDRSGALEQILFMISASFRTLGLVAELLVCAYHESQAKPTYTVRDALNIRRRN